MNIQEQVRQILSQEDDVTTDQYTTFTDKRKRGYRIKVMHERFQSRRVEDRVLRQLSQIPGVSKVGYCGDGFGSSDGYVVFTDIKPSSAGKDPMVDLTARVYNMVLDTYRCNTLDEIFQKYFNLELVN